LNALAWACDASPLADAETFSAPFQTFQHLDATQKAAPFGAKVRRPLDGFFPRLIQPVALLPQLRQCLASGAQPRLQRLVGRR